MSTVKEYNTYGERLETMMCLQTSPIAVKMLENESQIPEDTFRPKKDKNIHYAQCQVFSLSRRDRMTVAMLKEDNWCIGPPMAYGLVPMADDPAAKKNIKFDCFEYGRYIGMLTAPLKTSTFEPDVVLVYCSTNQLRDMLLSLKEEERPDVKSNFFYQSCAFAITTPILNNEYWINLPDPGEYVRALTQPGEMIFSIPAAKMSGFMENLEKFDKESMFAHEQMMMQADFPQPDIYKQVFKMWGMDHEE
ncbi:MAG: DUF169 domain-containing protein [Spirochaetes bacterium]|nr:DUF169 domain-containing protein [Spirochaetota bacterium]